MIRAAYVLFMIVVTVSTALPGHAQIEGNTWFPLGPAPIEGFFGGGVVGRASAIAVNPARLDELWIGSAAGGVWHSINGGVTWRPISEKQSSLAIGAIAVDGCTAAGCQRLFVGTGENAVRRDTYYGRGLLVIDYSDKNPAWQRRSGSPFNFDLGSINDVVIDPRTSGTNTRVFVTLSSGNTSSASQATLTAPEPMGISRGLGGYGIYRSDDSGLTWSALVVPGVVGAKPSDLKMHPENPDILYAGFEGIGLFVSDDSGDTWCPLNAGVPVPVGCTAATGLQPSVASGFDHVKIALHASAPQTLYASFGHCPDQLFQSCLPSIFRTTDGGQNWELRHQGTDQQQGINCPAIYSRYAHDISVHPMLPDVLLLGGLRMCRSTNGGTSFVTSDNNLAPGGSPWGPITHLDHREIVVHPLDANRVYETNDGGFAYSNNGGIDWLPGNGGLQITGFYSLTASSNTPRLLGGSQDNSGQLWLGFGGWEHVGGGDGAYAVIDLDDPLIMYLGGNAGRIYRSTDGGLSFNTQITPGSVAFLDRSFNAPLVQDSAPPHHLYYGGNRLMRSNNDGSNWSQVSPILATGVADEIWPGQNVITAIGAYDSRAYIGYYGGEVFFSAAPCNSQSCWTNVSSGLPAAPVTDIGVSEVDPDVAYLAYSGFSNQAHIWKTVDAGLNWVPADNGLPTGVPVNALVIEGGSVVWAGLDSGPEPDRSNVYRSNDGGSNWEPVNAGLPNSPVHDLAIDGVRGRLYAGLHGRGAYVLGSANAGTYSGYVNGQLNDVPVYGSNFPASQNCTLRLLQSSGHVCTTSSLDALGAQVRTDAEGRLVARNGAAWTDRSAVWACINGRCAGNVPIEACLDDADGDGADDLLSTVLIDCGGTPAVATITGSPTLSNPPGSLIDVGFYEVATRKNAGTALRRSVSSKPVTGAVKFRVSANVMSSGTRQTLCTSTVSVPAGRSTTALLSNAASSIQSESSCRAMNVTASLDTAMAGGGEDNFERNPRLLVSAPDSRGSQVVAGLHLSPGDAAPGTCLGIGGVGVPVLSQLQPMRSQFTTPPKGAAGGYVSYIERTGLGECAVTIKTIKGQSAISIASAIAEVLKTPARATDRPHCSASANSSGTRLEGDSLISPMAAHINVCIQDAAVGLELTPE